MIGRIRRWISSNWKTVGWVGVADLIKDHFKDKIVEFLISNLGKLGRFIYQDPFSLLTLFIVITIIRLLWSLLVDSLRTQSSIADAKGEPVYRSAIAPRVALRTALGSVLVGTLVVYGYFKYHQAPTVVMAEGGSFYGVGVRNSLLYINSNIWNYSPSLVIATVESKCICDGTMCPDGEKTYNMTFAPWGANHIDFGMYLLHPPNLPDPNDPAIAPMMKAFFKNKLEIEEVVRYNDGHKNVTYHWVGRLNHLTVDFVRCLPPIGCQGNIDTLTSDYR